MDTDDLKVISALVQDAIFPITELTWKAGDHRLAFLFNRLRREDENASGSGKQPVERVQSVLVVEHVSAVSSQGIDRSDKECVLSVLSVDFEAVADADGFVTVTLAGDGAIRARVEALEVSLRDVTRPYIAPSGKIPSHPD
jgi:hypothetical protein